MSVSNQAEEEAWKEIEIEGQFRLQIPRYATAGFQDEGTTVVIRLGQPSDATEILISSYGLGGSHGDGTALSGALKEMVAQFSSSVANALGQEVDFNVELGEDSDQKLYYAQGVAQIADERWWLVRAYARLGRGHFWLLHWNGTLAMMKSDVLRIFVSFDPA